MGKIIKCTVLILIISFASCNNKEFDEITDNIIYTYQKGIVFNFQQNKVTVTNRYFKFSDSIVLSKEEKRNILKSFNKWQISQFTGSFYFPTNNWIMPSFEDNIKIYRKNKLVSDFNINDRSNSNLNDVSDAEYKSTKFKEDLEYILTSNKKYLAVRDSLNSFKNNHRGFP